ncbi:hypothetical protein L3X38_042683 [Prunus dulcis]|uniref:Uncharacterized protein n=1 Tax=Prunus dulcis TaxID=3755 RepID=A0AAD4YKJ2_PRUDU|nr:hypothetical protein L3X38_042683 [Prunus dulcis]
MKPTARSLSILASMMATRLRAKLHLFCRLSWDRCLACRMATMEIRLCCSRGRLQALPFPLNLGASRSGLFSLACQDQWVLARRPLQAFILLQEKPPNGFPRLGPDSLIAIRE